MGALSDLLRQPPPAANPANPATRHLEPVADSRPSRDSQRGAPAITPRLLALSVSEHLPANIVLELPADELAACAGYSDDVLRAYLRARARGVVMDAGNVPDDYTKPCHCAGCGPVLLWPDCPDLLAACPWCFRRKAGRTIPDLRYREGHDLESVRVRGSQIPTFGTVSSENPMRARANNFGGSP